MALCHSSLNGPWHLLFLVYWVFVSRQGVEFCQVLFLRQVRWLCRFFPFILWMWCVLLIGFCRLKFLEQIPLVRCVILLIYYWIRFTSVAFCWGFCISVHQRYWSLVSLECLWLWCPGNAGFTEWVGSVSSGAFGIFWEGLIWILLHMFGRILQWSHPIQGFSLVIDLISLLVPDLLEVFLVPHDVVWVDGAFLGICPFHLSYPICWHAVVDSSLL